MLLQHTFKGSGQISDRCICPVFFQYWRGLRTFFFTGQIEVAKGTDFALALYIPLLVLLYINIIYICPICPIVNKASKGGLFIGTDALFYICPLLSHKGINN
jgi:hypothetical protein